MKRHLTMLCALLLCVLLPVCALAAMRPEGARTPECRNPEHWIGDGLDHNRPQSCWVTGHNFCDGADHTRAACGLWGHYNCDGREHLPAACGAEGHYACDQKAHAAAGCGVAGHCILDGKRHVPAGCGIAGHYRCEGGEHTAAGCGIAGHTVCDGLDHGRAACGAKGHTVCDGMVHARAACGIYGHCVSEGANHRPSECGYAGHMACDGRDHGQAACGVAGHFACEGRSHSDKVVSKYCNAVPQHKICEGNPTHYCDPAQGGCGATYECSRSNSHTACRMCGQLWCDRSLGGHETPCGYADHRPCVYAMSGRTYRYADHPACHLCGKGKCKGEHGNGVCVDSCPACGGPEKYGYSHFNIECRHYWCVSEGPHGEWCYACRTYKCYPGCIH